MKPLRPLPKTLKSSEALPPLRPTKNLQKDPQVEEEVQLATRLVFHDKASNVSTCSQLLRIHGTRESLHMQAERESSSSSCQRYQTTAAASATSETSMSAYLPPTKKLQKNELQPATTTTAE
jgi:hypothetical protein